MQKIPFARAVKGNESFTPDQMTPELYEFNDRWKGFKCPVQDCKGHLKWSNCTTKEKYWSHKPIIDSNGKVVPTHHSGETWRHVQGKAFVNDNLDNIIFSSKPCPRCSRLAGYKFAKHTCKIEDKIMEGIIADVAVYDEHNALCAIVSVVESHRRRPEQWQSLYDKLKIKCFQIDTTTIARCRTKVQEGVKGTHALLMRSDIAARWSLCKGCQRTQDKKVQRRLREPQFVLEVDGRHLRELNDSELRAVADANTTILAALPTLEQQRRAVALLRARGVCRNCNKKSNKPLCMACYKEKKTEEYFEKLREMDKLERARLQKVRERRQKDEAIERRQKDEAIERRQKDKAREQRQKDERNEWKRVCAERKRRKEQRDAARNAARKRQRVGLSELSPKQSFRFMGKSYTSNEEFLKEKNVTGSLAKNFFLVPAIAQDERRLFYKGRIKKCQ